MGSGAPQDLNDKGEVLFGTGIWAGGDWIPKVAPEITGVFPGSVSETYPDGIGYRVPPRDWNFFNNDRKLLQIGYVQPTDGPGVDSSAPSPVFWPAGQSSASLIYETADLWEEPYWYARPVGVSASGEMVVRAKPMFTASGSTATTERIDRFDASGTLVGSMDGTDGYHPSGQWQHGDMTPSGWVASNLARKATETQPAAYKVALWNPSNEIISLPAQADGWGYPVRVSDIPNSNIALVAGQWPGDVHSGRVFLSDAGGQVKYAESLSNHKIQLFAGDGTAMTSDHQLWRNGKSIPLRELCRKFGELQDAGWLLFPLKANNNGTYLIQAEGPNGELEAKLAAPIRVDGVDTTVNPVNLEAPDRGVDNISIRANNTPNNGHHSDTWIMAPISRTNTVRFRSAANPSLQLHLSAENATFTPAVLDSPDQQVEITGTGTATSESDLVVKVDGKETDCTIKVKAMKKRNVKVTVHAVGLNVVPLEIPVLPDLNIMKNYLNSVFLPQINAEIFVTSGPAEVPLGWDIGESSTFELSGPGSEGLHEGNGTFDFTKADELEQEDQYINSVLRDENAQINVYVLTRNLLGWADIKPGAMSLSGAAGMTRRTPRVILIDGKQNEIITTIAHEIGHCMIGYGHPDLSPLDRALAKLPGATPPERGPAPHEGVGAEEWKRRLLYSITLPVSGKTMVKSEWDAAETWLHQIIDNPQGQ